MVPLIQHKNMFQLNFILMNNIQSCFIVAHSALLHPNNITITPSYVVFKEQTSYHAYVYKAI